MERQTRQHAPACAHTHPSTISPIQVLIREYELSDYLAAADYLNGRDLDAIVLEYEFGTET